MQVDNLGNVSVVADQISDYTMRPCELGNLCLWDFIATTEKVYSRKGREDMEQQQEAVADDSEHCMDDGDDDTTEVDEGENSDEIQGDLSREGVNIGVLYHFLQDHSECHKKKLRLRKKLVVPVPIGPAMPRRDQPDAEARYSRLMLLLFKPWRMSGLEACLLWVH